MPSPLAHASLALLAPAVVRWRPHLHEGLGGRTGFFYLAVVAALLLPDIDFLLRLVIDDPTFRHGGATHSFAMGLLFGAVFLVVCRGWYGPRLPAAPVFIIGSACAWTHCLMDMATRGGGVMLLWPFFGERYTTIPLFFGARHSELLNWRLHLITLTTELLFIVPLWALTRWLGRQRSGSAIPISRQHRSSARG